MYIAIVNMIMDNKKLTSYSPELYYFFDSEKFKENDYQKSIVIVAKTVAQWCDYYSAKLLSPKKMVSNTTKEGRLPVNKKERDIFVKNLVTWIFENSTLENLFLLCLGNKEAIVKKSSMNSCPKFDHHDDTCCWVLNLTEKEFQQLKINFKKNKLPEDLFYESSQWKCIPHQPKTLTGKFFHSFGFKPSKGYTPKQREMEKNRN